VWRRAGEELITQRQAGEQQTDATRARLSSAQPGWREERTGMERERVEGMGKRSREKEFESSSRGGGYCGGAKGRRSDVG